MSMTCNEKYRAVSLFLNYVSACWKAVGHAKPQVAVGNALGFTG